MLKAPRYYIDIRTLVGNIYDEPGTVLKVVKHGDDPTTSPYLVMAYGPDYPQWGTDIESSGMYDVYLHRSDIGYILLRENVWLAGKDLDESIVSIKKLRVGACQNVINSNDQDQVLIIDVAGWDDSVTISSADGFLTIKSYQFTTNSQVRLIAAPTYKAPPNTFGELLFYKQSAREYASSYYFII